MMPSGTSFRRAALTSRFKAGFFSTLKQSSPEPSQLTQARKIAFRCRLTILRAGGERRDLLLLVHLPVDEGFDVGVIGVDDDHLRRPPRGAARLDRARRAVADLEERHEPRRAAPARELLVLAAQGGKIRAGAGAVFEQARLAHPQVHDPALVDEIVGDRLDEAGVRLGMLVGRLRLDHLGRFRSRRSNGPGSAHRRHRPSGGRC